METSGNVAALIDPPSARATHATLLACPRCHAGSLNVQADSFGCAKCGFQGGYKNGVYLTLDDRGVSYFDDLHGTMTAQNAREGVNEVFYAKQFAYMESILEPGMIVVDIGCGPSIGYRRPANTLLIGVDPSFQSIVVNRNADIRVFGGAQALPIASASADVVVCFYSVHHMIGATIAETRQNVRTAFGEFRRVVKSGGKVVVFEVNPYWPFWVAEQLFWKSARRLLGKAVDFYFWSHDAMTELGRRHLDGAALETERYRADWRTAFPPAFSIQWLRMPFLFYPFHVARFTWTL